MGKNGWASVLEAACSGASADGCCDLREPNGECCMAASVREQFRLIETAGGPSLEQCEAIARGELVLAKVYEGTAIARGHLVVAEIVAPGAHGQVGQGEADAKPANEVSPANG
jgi:hypothetical protein